MLEDLPDVPPALNLILAELVRHPTIGELRRIVKGMLPDLRDQSRSFILRSTARDSYDRDPLRFDIHLHGALDLLSGRGCSELRCRVNAAERIARSVGLIADRIWLTDHLSEKLADFGRVSNAKLDDVINDVLALSPLLPLIKAGIIRFRSTWICTCAHCAEEFDAIVENTSQSMVRQFRHDFKVKPVDDRAYTVSTGKCFDPPLFFRGLVAGGENIPSALSFAKSQVADEIESALWVAREAAMSGGSVFSNSRLGLAGLLHQEKPLTDRKSFFLMDNEREFSVPWVSELDASQILQLREEASKALPVFREKMAAALNAAKRGSDESVAVVIEELREQAAEVRAELVSTQANSTRFWRATYAILGLGISAYGVATNQLATGVGGLLPVIQLLIDHNSRFGPDLGKLLSHPGYVLVKAQDILAHAH